MKEYEVCYLVDGIWEFECVINNINRKSASKRAHESSRKRGTIRIRLLK
jgi:hypothetical protein